MASTSPLIDGIILAFLAIGALIGFASGLTRLVSLIASWVGAFFLGITGTRFLKPLVSSFITNDFLAGILTGISSFIISLTLLIFITRQLSAWVKRSFFGEIDRPLGMFFGVFLGVFALSALYNLAPVVLNKDTQERLSTQSRLAPYLQEGAVIVKESLVKWMPVLLDMLDVKNQAFSSALIPSAPIPGISPGDLVNRLSQPPTASGMKGYSGEDRSLLEKVLEEPILPVDSAQALDPPKKATPPSLPQRKSDLLKDISHGTPQR